MPDQIKYGRFKSIVFLSLIMLHIIMSDASSISLPPPFPPTFPPSLQSRPRRALSGGHVLSRRSACAGGRSEVKEGGRERAKEGDVTRMDTPYHTSVEGVDAGGF